MSRGGVDPIKVVFLDIDGVICCNAYGRLEEAKLELLKHVCLRTGAKVVLSTDWRRVPQLKAQLISTLKLYGLQCIGATPCRPNWLAVRPEEIVAWTKGYNSAPNSNEKPPISHWVAVDDRPLLQEQGGDELRGHFVRTKLAVGLTERLAQRMIDVLMGDESQADPSPSASPVFGQMQLSQQQPSPSLSVDVGSPQIFAPKVQRAESLSMADQRRSAALPSYTTAYTSGFSTPPPVSGGGGMYSGASTAPTDAEAKAAMLRSYAAGRPTPALSQTSGLRRNSASSTPPRFGSVQNPGAPQVGRSPTHIGANGPTSGAANAWWNSRPPGGSSGQPQPAIDRYGGAPGGTPPPRSTVYGASGVGARPRFSH